MAETRRGTEVLGSPEVYRYILEVDPGRFADGLDVGHQRKRQQRAHQGVWPEYLAKLSCPLPRWDGW